MQHERVGVGTGWTEGKKGHWETIEVIWQMLKKLARTEKLEGVVTKESIEKILFREAQ